MIIVSEVSTGFIKAVANLTRHEVGENSVEYWEDFNHAIGTAVEPGCVQARNPDGLHGGGHGTHGLRRHRGRTNLFHWQTHAGQQPQRRRSWFHPLEKVFEVSSNVGSALAVEKPLENSLKLSSID